MNMRALRHHPDEHRHGVLGQIRHRVLPELLEVERLHTHAGIEVDSRTPGPPLVIRDQHAIDIRLRDARKAAKTLRHLRRADILALPAERIAQAVHKVPFPVIVPPQRVTASIVQVPLLKDIRAKALIGRLLRAPIPLERLLIRHRDQHLSALAIRVPFREASRRVAPDIACFVVDGNRDVHVFH